MDTNRFMPPTSFFIELALKCDRRQIFKMCLFVLLPVKYFDIFSDGLNGLGARFEAPVMHQLIFEQSPLSMGALP